MDSLFLLFSTLLLSSILYLLLSTRTKLKAPLPPGPKGLPVLGNLLQIGAKPHRTLHEMAKIYGPLMRLRLGSWETIIVSSPVVASQFFRVNDVNFSNRAKAFFGDYMSYDHKDIIFAPYGPRWRMWRKLCASHLFSQKAMDTLSPIRHSEISHLVLMLRARANGKPVDMGKALAVCANNALSMVLFSERVYGDDYDKFEEVLEFEKMGMEFIKFAGNFVFSEYVPSLSLLDVNLITRFKKLHKKYDVFFENILANHSKERRVGDLLSVLTKLKEEGGFEGTEITNTDIKALLFDLFIAGADTSTFSIEWGLTELVRRPDILRRAQDELDSVVGRDRLVRESDLPQLTLLQAIVKETFRLHPPSPLATDRSATETCEINGYTILKGARVFLNLWALGYDPAVWDEPLEFRPERFLPGGGHEDVDVRGNSFELMPFGAGRRICVGINLGLRMVQLMMATLVHAFDWALPEGQTADKLDIEEEYGLGMKKLVPLQVHPIPRLAEQAYKIS